MKTERTPLQKRPRYPKPKQSKMDRYFPDLDEVGHRKAVCKRCHYAMSDAEPASADGEYWHPDLKNGCRNTNLRFSSRDLEVVPWLPKSRRRALKRMKVRP